MALLLLPNQIIQPPIDTLGNRPSLIGAAGSRNFGVGALIPPDIIYDPFYNPIHILSGSFM
jgi:hypothetical protein